MYIRTDMYTTKSDCTPYVIQVLHSSIQTVAQAHFETLLETTTNDTFQAIDLF